MKNKLIIIARMEARKESVELVKAELLKLIEPTRKEKGCIQYDLQQDNDHPEMFLFYEIWETRDLWQIHTKNAHLAAYKAATEGHLADVTINEMTMISSDL